MRPYPSLSNAKVSPDDVGVPLEQFPKESGTRAAARAALDGRKKGLLAILPFLGPAFIASVAYIDPGNFATNIAGGSAFGYKLLWVIALANLMAMLLQTLSAKLGLATGTKPGRTVPTRVSQTSCLYYVDYLRDSGYGDGSR